MMDPHQQSKITPAHLERKAVVYLRQSTDRQVHQNTESQRLQYALVERARELGFREVEVIDEDLGSSAAPGAPERRGFKGLIGSVAVGEIGIVLSRELSRLLRSDKDWCQVAEVCQVFGTLLGDGERVYDLDVLDDQLILGIKATLSVVELKVLKLRMLEGTREKARRGELVRVLPPGYVRDNTGEVVKDPDERVRESIALVFSKFREARSVRQAWLWFYDRDMELPVNKPSADGMKIRWQVPKQSFVGNVLRNPFYAGAYFWGLSPTTMTVVEGRLVKRQRRVLRLEESEVFIPDHHEGYIDWETFQENLRVIRNNSTRGDGEEAAGAVRAGNGLLVGLLRCGRCGRKLHVRYWGQSGTWARYVCKGDYDSGGKYCIGFGGGKVDGRFSQELLRVISPLGVRASLRAIEGLSAKDHEMQEALHRQLEELEYEARRAFEQYNEVDARNRLVAAELERRWNAKLEEVEKAKASLTELESRNRALTEEDEAQIFDLGDDFQRVWRDEGCGVELKKKIVRAVVEEIVVDLDEERTTLRFIVHWKGGAHTRFEMPRPPTGAGRRTEVDDLEIIRKMASHGYGDNEIARVLVNLDRKTAKGKSWNERRVKSVRDHNSIAGQKHTARDPEILTRNEAARQCGVSSVTIQRLVRAGTLRREQVVPWAPWEIRRSDLDSEPVRKALRRLRETGRLGRGGEDSAGQLSFFEE